MARNRKVYLIDSENVGKKWIKHLPELRRSDRVVVFCSDKITCTQEDLEGHENLKDKVTFVTCTNGRANAMDFCIVFWIGYHARTAPKTQYIVISNDKGFDAILEQDCIQNLRISRIPTAAGKPAEKYAMDITPISSAKEIPSKANQYLKTIMKARYYNLDENRVLAYNAIASGSSYNIDHAVRQLTQCTPSPMDELHMKRTWTNYIPCIQRIYKENNGA